MDTLKVWGRIPSQHLGVLILAGVISTLLPSAVHTQRVLSFSKPLTIHTPKAEPPRIAFDLLISDAKPIDTQDEWSLLKNATSSISLIAGEHRFSGKSGVEILRSQKVVLQPMVFSHQEAQQTLEKEQQDRSWIADLPSETQKRLGEANAKYGVLEKDWAPPSFHDLAEEKIREYKGSSEAADVYRSGKVFVSATNAQGETHTTDDIHTADVQTRDSSGGGTIIAGNIVYKDPLPSGPQWVTRYYQSNGNIIQSEGSSTGDGKFTIAAANKVGTLIARVEDKNTGQVIGEGSIRLSEMTALHPTIEIHKSTSQLAVNLSSFYNHTQQLIGVSTGKDRGATAKVYFASLDHTEQTDQLGSAQIDQVLNGSVSLVRTESEGYYPEIFLARSGEEKRYPLFPTKMIQALKKIISDQQRFSQFDENGSVVWGQIVRGGNPVGGAQVTVESDDGYQPVYFNSLMIPDPTLKSTSDNGYFVVMNLEPGMHSLLASQAGIYLSHVNVVTDEDAVSLADMTSSMERDAVSVRSYDAFYGSAVSSEFEIQSLPQALSVQGFATVNLPLRHQLSLANVHATDPTYLDTTLVYDEGADHIHAPMIRASWLTAIQQDRKINIDPSRGTVIGFVPSTDFDVYLPNDSQYAADQIVYFDANGSATEHGVAGGGFILFNVKAGVQSVVVGDKNSEMLQTQVVPVDTQTMATLNFQ